LPPSRRNDYVSQHIGKTTSDSAVPDGDAAAAKYHGYIAGRQTEIRPGVSGSNQAATIPAPDAHLLVN
jgi:hypothetical protein